MAAIVLASAGLGVWLVAVGLFLWGTLSTIFFFLFSSHKKFSSPPISILKPLKGLDSDLAQNLESFFQLSYKDFEILFCVENSTDPSFAVAQALLEKYPQVNAKILVGMSGKLANPKVDNMMKGYEVARHDWVLISDSNVRVAPHYLKRMAQAIAPDVGLITAVVCGTQARSFGAGLEATYLNTFYARWMVLAALVGKPCVVGKSMLFKKSVASRFGGLATLSLYLAEDFMAGQAMKLLGLRVALMKEPVYQVIGRYSVQSFWQRHLRWGRIRKAQAPAAFFFEVFLGVLASGAIGAFSLSLLGASAPTVKAFFLSHVLISFFCDFLVTRALRSDVNAFILLYWIAREFLALPLWFHMALGSSVLWRGRRLKIENGGLLEKGC